MGSCVSRRFSVTIDEDDWEKAIGQVIDEMRNQLENNKVPIQLNIRPVTDK